MPQRSRADPQVEKKRNGAKNMDAVPLTETVLKRSFYRTKVKNSPPSKNQRQSRQTQPPESRTCSGITVTSHQIWPGEW